MTSGILPLYSWRAEDVPRRFRGRAEAIRAAAAQAPFPAEPAPPAAVQARLDEVLADGRRRSRRALPFALVAVPAIVVALAVVTGFGGILGGLSYPLSQLVNRLRLLRAWRSEPTSWQRASALRTTHGARPKAGRPGGLLVVTGPLAGGSVGVVFSDPEGHVAAGPVWIRGVRRRRATYLAITDGTHVAFGISQWAVPPGRLTIADQA